MICCEGCWRPLVDGDGTDKSHSSAQASSSVSFNWCWITALKINVIPIQHFNHQWMIPHLNVIFHGWNNSALNFMRVVVFKPLNICSSSWRKSLKYIRQLPIMHSFCIVCYSKRRHPYFFCYASWLQGLFLFFPSALYRGSTLAYWSKQGSEARSLPASSRGGGGNAQIIRWNLKRRHLLGLVNLLMCPDPVEDSACAGVPRPDGWCNPSSLFSTQPAVSGSK